MKLPLLVCSLAFSISTIASACMAEPQEYLLAPKWSQIVFSYDHLGFSRTTGMFSGIEGKISFVDKDPAASSVSVSFPVLSLFTGLEQRDANFTLGGDFFAATAQSQIMFTSTKIEVTGENTAKITGDLTMNSRSQSVVLDTKLNKIAFHDKEQKDWIGFDATTSLYRSEFGLGKYAPGVSDNVDVSISIEAMKAE